MRLGKISPTWAGCSAAATYEDGLSSARKLRSSSHRLWGDTAGDESAT